VEHTWVQLYGFKIMTALAKGGAKAETYVARCANILQQAMCRHHRDSCLMYWVLKATGRLGGERALVEPLHRGAFWTTTATSNALRCLAEIDFGQSDGASVNDAPAIVDIVITANDWYPSSGEVMYEASAVLAVVTFVIAGPHSAAVPWNDEKHSVTKCGLVEIHALIRLLHSWVSDWNTYFLSTLAQTFWLKLRLKHASKVSILLSVGTCNDLPR